MASNEKTEPPVGDSCETPEGKKETKKKGGFFSGLGAKLEKVGKDVSKAADSAATSVSKTVDENWKSQLLDCFKTGMIVQLVCRSSGKSLQVLDDNAINGLGAEGKDAKDTLWTAINDGKNTVRLHNGNRYLAIEDGVTMVKVYDDPAQTGPEVCMRLQQKDGFISMESVAEPKRHIGILADGSLKSALITTKENDAQFAVRVIYSPYPDPAKK